MFGSSPVAAWPDFGSDSYGSDFDSGSGSFGSGYDSGSYESVGSLDSYEAGVGSDGFDNSYDSVGTDALNDVNVDAGSYVSVGSLDAYEAGSVDAFDQDDQASDLSRGHVAPLSSPGPRAKPDIGASSAPVAPLSSPVPVAADDALTGSQSRPVAANDGLLGRTSVYGTRPISAGETAASAIPEVSTEPTGLRDLSAVSENIPTFSQTQLAVSGFTERELYGGTRNKSASGNVDASLANGRVDSRIGFVTSLGPDRKDIVKERQGPIQIGAATVETGLGGKLPDRVLAQFEHAPELQQNATYNGQPVTIGPDGKETGQDLQGTGKATVSSSSFVVQGDFGRGTRKPGDDSKPHERAGTMLSASAAKTFEQGGVTSVHTDINDASDPDDNTSVTTNSGYTIDRRSIGVGFGGYGKVAHETETPGPVVGTSAGAEMGLGLKGVRTVEEYSAVSAPQSNPNLQTHLDSRVQTNQIGLGGGAETTSASGLADLSGQANGRARYRADGLIPVSRSINSTALETNDGAPIEQTKTNTRSHVAAPDTVDAVVQSYGPSGAVESLSTARTSQGTISPNFEEQVHISAPHPGSVVIDEPSVEQGWGVTITNRSRTVSGPNGVTRTDVEERDGTFTDQTTTVVTERLNDGTVRVSRDVLVDGVFQDQRTVTEKVVGPDGLVHEEVRNEFSGYENMVETSYTTLNPNGQVKSGRTVDDPGFFTDYKTDAAMATEPDGSVRMSGSAVADNIFADNSSGYQLSASPQAVNYSDYRTASGLMVDSRLERDLTFDGQQSVTRQRNRFDQQDVTIESAIDVTAQEILGDDGVGNIAAYSVDPNGGYGLAIRSLSNDDLAITTSPAAVSAVSPEGRAVATPGYSTVESLIGSQATYGPGSNAISINRTEGDITEQSRLGYNPTESSIRSQVVNDRYLSTETDRVEIVDGASGVEVSRFDEMTSLGIARTNQTDVSVDPNADVSISLQRSIDYAVHADSVRNLDARVTQGGAITGSAANNRDSIFVYGNDENNVTPVGPMTRDQVQEATGNVEGAIERRRREGGFYR